MRCGEAKRLMQMTLAGDTTGADQQQLDEHLETCPNCAPHWAGMSECAEAVHAVAPTALAIERDLASDILECVGASRAGDLSRTHRVRRLTVGAAAALILVALAVGLITRSHGPNAVLSIVEAATAVRPSHMVIRIFDGSGTPTAILETWRCPGGKRYTECRDLISGTRTIHLSREGANILWVHEVGTNEYKLTWGGHAPEELFGVRSDDIKHPGLPRLISEDSLMAGVHKLFGMSIVSVQQTQEQWHGQKVRIFDIQVTPSRRPDDSRFRGKSEFKYFLTPDLRRLVRELWILYDENGERSYIQDSWPIEYDVQPPESLQIQVPRDAKATFRGRDIDPLWEYIDQAEREKITQAVLALAHVWRKGDFEEFAKHYDFRAGLEYGVKGKFTAEQMREHWRFMVTQQQGRWADYQLTVDYGFGTPEPPAMALTFWNIYRKRPQSGGGWHLYGQEPSKEPGIVVLAGVKATDHDGETRELGTQLFLKKIHGEYKVILWRPPFA